MNSIKIRGASPQVKATVAEWDKLSEEERKTLIPYLLTSIHGWRGWSFKPDAVLVWLKGLFEKVHLPFPSYPGG